VDVSSLVLSSLELIDIQVYEPQIRALLGTASPFCEVSFLNLRMSRESPLSSELGTYKTVKARSWPWLRQKSFSPQFLLGPTLLQLWLKIRLLFPIPPNQMGPRMQPRVGALGGRPFFSSLVLSSLELSDIQVYEPRLRALLGTASHFCDLSFLNLRTLRDSPMSSELCTYKTVKARFWPWLSGKSPYFFGRCSLFARKRTLSCSFWTKSWASFSLAFVSSVSSSRCLG